MAQEVALSYSVASVMEDLLQEHSDRVGDLDLESRKAEEAASRRHEAAGWLRMIVGVVAARDLPAEPSEEEFRLGLRSGIILCNALNKIQAGAVPKVVESPADAALIPDGAALSAFQHFENVRNCLVSLQEMGLPTFEASDLEQGGNSARVVSCILALKSFSDWKQTGGNGVWKFGSNIKSATLGKSFVRKNSEPFMKSLSRTSSMHDKSLKPHLRDLDSNKMSNIGSLSKLVRAVLSDKNPEEVPMLVESVLSKVVEELELRVARQCEYMKITSKEGAPHGNKLLFKPLGERKTEEKIERVIKREESLHRSDIVDEETKSQLLKKQIIFDQQQKDIQELRQTLHDAKAGMQFMKIKLHEDFRTLGKHVYGLARAASGYHSVLEENRKLYNQVQDLKGSIRVYCRVRPFLSGQPGYLSTVDHIEDGNIVINTLSKHGKGNKSFSFNKVFGPHATQDEVFIDMQPLIRSVLDGYNVCIFAYGQTGSGKTHTMSGPKELTEKSRGVNYRALGDLFLIAEQRKDTFCYDVSVQMMEIYNEQVRDLLVTDGSNKRLEIRNKSETGLSVPDANIVPVSSTYDVINLMNLGQKNRVVGATALNDRSSRSHSCLTVHVQGKDLTSGATLRGCMHLVDLAGSERVNKSEVTGDRLKEAQHINRSLSALGDVIASLAQKNPHVPYRNSKLTQLLQDSLGGQAKTLMFVHISPEPDSLGESISTLKFAERVATVELGAARVNKDNSDVKDLKEQIATLKAELARKEGETAHTPKYIPGSSEKNRVKTNGQTPYSSNLHLGDVWGDHDSWQQPMGEVGNIEIHGPVAAQKTRSFNLDKLLVAASSPIACSAQTYENEDKVLDDSGEWVDKVMVNKQDAKRNENHLQYWETNNVNLPDVFFQNYLADSSKVYPDQSYNINLRNERLNNVNVDDIDDRYTTTTTTSDSSESDLHWHINQSKQTSVANGIRSKIKRPNILQTSELRLNPTTTHSPLRKQVNGIGSRGGRQLTTTDMKRKAAKRK